MDLSNPFPPFDLVLNGVTMHVKEFDLQGKSVFRIEFSSRRRSIIITRAEAPGGKKFWTSIPEGRQKEAEGIGPMIEKYIKSTQ